jgi:hypothetical protein
MKVYCTAPGTWTVCHKDIVGQQQADAPPGAEKTVVINFLIYYLKWLFADTPERELCSKTETET